MNQEAWENLNLALAAITSLLGVQVNVTPLTPDQRLTAEAAKHYVMAAQDALQGKGRYVA